MPRREQRDRDRRGGGDDGGERRCGQRVRAPPATAARPGRARDREPVDEHRGREREEGADDAAAVGRARASATDRAGAGAMPAVPSPARCAATRRRQRLSSQSTSAVSATSTSASTRRRPVEERSVLEVDRARERVVAHQRDDAEVGERVERDEQRAGADRRPQRRQRHAPEDRERRPAEPAPGFLERRIDDRAAPPRRAAARRGTSRASARPARPSSRRSPAAARPRAGCCSRPARAERAEQAEGGDVARDHERERRADGPELPAGEVGAGRQPGDRDADRHRGECDADDEEPGAPDQLESVRAGQDTPAAASSRRRWRGRRGTRAGAAAARR